MKLYKGDFMAVLFEYIGIAFLCSWILIIVSKILMTKLLRKDKDYYKENDFDKNKNGGGHY